MQLLERTAFCLLLHQSSPDLIRSHDADLSMMVTASLCQHVYPVSDQKRAALDDLNFESTMKSLRADDIR